MQTIKSSLYSPGRGGFDTIVTARNSSTWRNKAFDLTTRFTQFLRTHWRNWCEARSRYATKRALEEIDDRMLKDIGLHRSQIDSAAITPMAERIAHRRWLTVHTARCTEFKTQPTRRRCGLRNAPWISEAITIHRGDLF